MLLLQIDILPDQSGNLVRLFGLQPGDALLQQIAALHVQEEGTVLAAHLPRADHLGERPMLQRFVRVHVQEVDSAAV